MTQPEVGQPGRLRVAIAISQAGGAFWSFPGVAGGAPHGVAVDLAHALAQRLGLSLDLVAHPNSDAITRAASLGTWDATFIPFDAERARHMAFGPVYNRSESTLLVRAGLAADHIDNLDQDGRTILAVTKTTTGRALAAWVRRARVVEVDTIEEIGRRIADGTADAFAMSRDALERMARDLPGTHVARGRFFEASTAYAVPPGRPHLLAAGTQVLRDAMRDGTLRRILDANGMADAAIPD